ncbi:helix-turn-helix transcriptional regulator [Aquimarina sp. Aq78]|uniref:helix-turn-helix domain-containing protein n=1 Tax=Aquimarina sp. Aq78 TaxID=1191889 RepID=UPI000D0E5A7E|nr:helix-turn-helix transcriptional regulator [Aquimarina sp. Aq78]
MNSLEVKNNRKKYNLTQGQLAKMIGVSKKTIANYEAGETIPNTKRVILHRVFDELKQNKQETEHDGDISSDKEIEYLKKINSFLEKENKYIRENFGKEIKGLKGMVETLTKDNSKLKEVGTKINKIIEELSIKYQIDDEIKKVKNDEN